VETAVRVRRVTPFCIVAVLVAVAEDQQVIVNELFEELLLFFSWKQKPAFAVGDRYVEHFSLLDFVCENTFASIFQFQVDPATAEALRNVGRQRSFRVSAHAFKARQQAFFHEHLEAVAYSQYGTVFIDESAQFFAELSLQQPRPNCSRAHVISIGEAAGKNQYVVIHEVSLLDKFVEVPRFSLNA